jgi:hypothetical protein
MSGIFEELEMFDEGDKIATRQAIAVANKRFNDRFAGFLRQASTKKEFANRLALVDADINNMVGDVANEYGGDAEKIAKAIKASVKQGLYELNNDPWTQAVSIIIEKYPEIVMGDPEGAKYHLNQIKDRILSSVGPTASVEDVVEAIKNEFNLNGPNKNAEDPYNGYSSDNKISNKDKRPEHLKAQDEDQMASEHSQVEPWLKKQNEDEDQEDGGNLRNKEAASEKCETCECDPCECKEHESKTADIHSQPIANPVPLAETPGYTAGGQDIESSLEVAPSAIGTGKTGADSQRDHIVLEHEPRLLTKEFELADQGDPNFQYLLKLEAKFPEIDFRNTPERDIFRQLPKFPLRQLLAKLAGAHKVEQKDGKFFVIEDGDEKAAGPFDSREEAEARADKLNGLENLEKEAARPGEDQRIPSSSLCEECQGNGYVQAGPGLAIQQRCPSCNGVGTSDPIHRLLETTNPTNPNRDKTINFRDVFGSTNTPAMERAIALKEAAAKVETGDSVEERESLPTGNEDAHDGPSPKMDKKKWVPNATNPDGNLKPIKTEGEHSPHPTREMDIKQHLDYAKNDDPWENDNSVWERQTLPNKRDHDSAGFESTRNIQEETKAAETWSDKSTQANPVTKVSLPEALAEKTVASVKQSDWREEGSAFRNWLAENGINISTEEGVENSPVIEQLWNQYTESLSGANAPYSEEDEFMDMSEEPMIEEAPEEIEEIIEEGDNPNDRVEVMHEEFDGGDDDLLTEEEFDKLLTEAEESDYEL